MSPDRFESTLIGLIYFAAGFLCATVVLYSELRRARRKSAMLEKMNDRHNARIMECKTGSFKVTARWIVAERPRPE